jgi:6-phosphofructokinase
MTSTNQGLPKRVGILFSGGPAPAANAVIAAAVSSFRRAGVEVVGFLHGYSGLVEYDATSKPLVEETHYHLFNDRDLRGLRNGRGIIIGTSRANPGKKIRGPADLADPERSAPLRRVCEGLRSLGVEALVSIGGDDTLKTANFLYEYQRGLPEGAPKVAVVHVPKTIDNDYRRHRLHVRLLHRRRRDGEGAHEPARRRDGDVSLFRGRDDGPKGRLARIRRLGSRAKRTSSSPSRT